MIFQLSSTYDNIQAIHAKKAINVGNTMTIPHTEIRKYTPPGILLINGGNTMTKTTLISTKGISSIG